MRSLQKPLKKDIHEEMQGQLNTFKNIDHNKIGQNNELELRRLHFREMTIINGCFDVINETILINRFKGEAINTKVKENNYGIECMHNVEISTLMKHLSKVINLINKDEEAFKQTKEIIEKIVSNKITIENAVLEVKKIETEVYNKRVKELKSNIHADSFKFESLKDSNNKLYNEVVGIYQSCLLRLNANKNKLEDIKNGLMLLQQIKKESNIR